MSYHTLKDYIEALDVLANPNMIFSAESVVSTLDSADATFSQKVETAASVLERMESETNALDQEISVLVDRKETLKSRTLFIKNYVKGFMESAGLNTFSSSRFTVQIEENSPRILVYDRDAVPSRYFRVIAKAKLDRSAIKDTLSAGIDIPGTELIYSTRLVVYEQVHREIEKTVEIEE
jgi:hypothetical protein